MKLYRKCWKSTVLHTNSPYHILPNRMVQQCKKIVQLWKALGLCLTPVDCQKKCGLKPVILRYTYSTILDLYQWKVRHLWKHRLDAAVVSVLLFPTHLCCLSPNHITKVFDLTLKTSGLVNTQVPDYQDFQITRHQFKEFCYTGCPRRNVPDFGRVFLMLKYTDITQKTYIQS